MQVHPSPVRNSSVKVRTLEKRVTWDKYWESNRNSEKDCFLKIGELEKLVRVNDVARLRPSWDARRDSRVLQHSDSEDHRNGVA